MSGAIAASRRTTPSLSDYPNADTTGVPTGTVLTAYSGPSNVSTNGTVIDSKTITTGLVITGDNITIRKCLIRATGFFWNVLNDYDGGTNLLIEDCEIDSLDNTTGDSAINCANTTVRRCDIHSAIDGMKVGTNVTIEDSYIHDLTVFGDSHNDAIQCLGTTGLTIRHNTIICPAGGTSAILLSTGSASDMRNILINDNLLAGGAYTVYGGYQSGVDVLSRVSNISITNNQFSTQIYANSGAFGPLTSRDSPVVVSGNTWHDGPSAGQTVS